MKALETIQKTAILHCVYQMIASADGSINEERDIPAITFALTELGLVNANSWDSALQMNPHDCFIHIAGISDNDKQLFKTLLYTIAEMGGNTFFRVSCANHLLKLCMI